MIIFNYFTQKEKEKRKLLRQINHKIATSTNYNELVELTNEYNKIKYENKTDKRTRIFGED